MERLWISSMEDAAIRDGFEHLRPGSDYDTLYDVASAGPGLTGWLGLTLPGFSLSCTGSR